MEPHGLLDCLRLGSNLQGFFKPLTAAAPSRAWYSLRSELPLQAIPMTGCHITMQGTGVQWMHAQVLNGSLLAHVPDAIGHLLCYHF